MKRILILCCMLLPIFAVAQRNQLADFSAIMEEFKAGNTVKAVFDYAACQLISDNEVQERQINAIGGFTLDTWEYFAEGAIRNDEAFVVSSTSKLIQNPLGDGYVYNYVKVKIMAGGKVKITATYVEATTFEEKMTENFFTTISEGETGGAKFYKM